eukprot:scaffold115353_cov17-Tisochrysis_lutea.AAC.1
MNSMKKDIHILHSRQASHPPKQQQAGTKRTKPKQSNSLKVWLIRQLLEVLHDLIHCHGPSKLLGSAGK